MKIFKRTLLTLLFLLLVITGTLTIIAFAYENEVKDYMIRELNKNLKTQVIVDSRDIHLTLLRSFPYASLDFENVKMLESALEAKKGKSARPDTLFAVEKLSLQFNLLDIFSKNYVVKKVKGETGKVKLKVRRDGSVNWDVWKVSGDTAVTSSDEESAFNLEKFQLSNIDFIYLDHKSKTDIAGSIHSGTIGGEFSSREYDLSVKGDMHAEHFRVDSVNYLTDKPVKMDLNLKVDNDKDVYLFSNAVVSISDLEIGVEGRYVDSKPRFTDIYLKGKDMDVRSVLSLLPEKYQEQVKDYDSDGEFYCNARISGNWDDASTPEVKADFGISNAEITQLSSGIVLKDVHLLGNYYAAEKNHLEIKSFSALLANGKVNGNFRMDNFPAPFVATEIKADFPLEDIRHFLKIDTLWNYPIAALHGNMKVNMSYKGQLSSSRKYKKEDFDNMNLSGELTLENSGMKIKDSELEFDSVNGSLVLNNNSIALNSFSGKTRRSDFFLKGNLKDILAFSFTDNADLNVEATFQSDNFDLNELLLNQDKSSKRDTVYKVQFSPRVNFVLNSNIGHLTFRKFEASNIRGTFQLRNQKLIADPVSFSAMDGSITASGMIDNTIDSTLLITCNASLKKLNISKLFDQLEDFGQNTLTHRHLKGIGTAEVQFASVWKSDLTVDLNRIYARSNITIQNGELKRFEPMNALSKYISVSELEHIKFSTLQNEIEIKDQKAFIPKMDIHSSALDVTLSGTHSFNDEIDYHFKVLMSDVLFRKASKAKRENDEFGVVEDDKSGRTSLFISMTGTVDDPIIKYDKQGAKQNLKENIAEEKHTLRQILREEFGWFKKDTTLDKKKEKPNEAGKFIIQWEEEEKAKKKEEDDDF